MYVSSLYFVFGFWRYDLICYSGSYRQTFPCQEKQVQKHPDNMGVSEPIGWQVEARLINSYSKRVVIESWGSKVYIQQVFSCLWAIGSAYNRLIDRNSRQEAYIIFERCMLQPLRLVEAFETVEGGSHTKIRTKGNIKVLTMLHLQWSDRKMPEQSKPTPSLLPLAAAYLLEESSLYDSTQRILTRSSWVTGTHLLSSQEYDQCILCTVVVAPSLTCLRIRCGAFLHITTTSEIL